MVWSRSLAADEAAYPAYPYLSAGAGPSGLHHRSDGCGILRGDTPKIFLLSVDFNLALSIDPSLEMVKGAGGVDTHLFFRAWQGIMGVHVLRCRLVGVHVPPPRSANLPFIR